MAVEERARRELQEVLVDTIGSDHTDTLLSYLPPVGWADVATKQDLGALEARLDGQIAELRGEMHSLGSELRGEVAELRGEMGELRGEMHSLGSGLRGEMGELRGEMHSLGSELRGEVAELRSEMHQQLRTQFHWTVGLFLTSLVIVVMLATTGLLG